MRDNQAIAPMAQANNLVGADCRKLLEWMRKLFAAAQPDRYTAQVIGETSR
jgi:hypothetical protein